MTQTISLPDLRLVTERLVLRPPAEADLATITALIGDPAISRNLAQVPFPYRYCEAVAWLERTRRELAAGSDVPLVIERDGAAVGGLGLHGLPEAAILGYWLGRPHWGKGFATEAVRRLLAFGFDELGVDKVLSGVFFDNPASLRVQEKLGFERTGKSELFCLARGHAVDHIDTILKRADFQAANP